MPKIFISYRRTDSEAVTGRISDRLAQAFGAHNLVQDVGDAPPGEDFRAHRQAVVSQCNVELVIIGKQWAATAYDDGRKRLDDPADLVRIEVEAGLSRRDMLVIPVLVNGAGMPAASELPASLQELRYRNAIAVRNNPDFSGDINRLVAQLKLYDKTLPASQSRFSWTGIAAIAAALLVIVIAGILFLANQGNLPPVPPTLTPIPPTAEPTQAITSTPSPLTPNATFTQGVNVRSGPSMLFAPPIGSFAAGETTEIIAVSPAGDWYKVRYHDTTGWVSALNVTVSGDISKLPRDPGPPTPAAALSPTPRQTPTPTVPLQPSPTPSPTATHTPLPTATPTRTPRPSDTATRTPNPSDTPTPRPTLIAIPKPSSTP